MKPAAWRQVSRMLGDKPSRQSVILLKLSAGVAIAIVVSLVLGVLGLAVGIGIPEPSGGGAPVKAISIGSGIHALVSGLIAIFAGATPATLSPRISNSVVDILYAGYGGHCGCARCVFRGP